MIAAAQLTYQRKKRIPSQQLRIGDINLKTDLRDSHWWCWHLILACLNPDYSYDFNMSESDAPPTTYLPEGFTYLPSQVCPERLPSMSKYIIMVFIWRLILMLYFFPGSWSYNMYGTRCTLLFVFLHTSYLCLYFLWYCSWLSCIPMAHSASSNLSFLSLPPLFSPHTQRASWTWIWVRYLWRRWRDGCWRASLA